MYVIRTPENVGFTFELAGIPGRALAWGIDAFVMFIMITAAVMAVSPFAAVLGDFAAAVLSVTIFLVVWWYSALCEWRLSGRTLGKMAVRLRTIDGQGRKLSFYQAVVRNLIRVVDLLPGLYLLGALSAWLDPHGRRLGDLAAGTVVVKERRPPRPSALLRPEARDAGLSRDPAFREAARRVTPHEREAMLALCMRRERLPLSVRHELFDELAGHLERRLGVGRPAHLSSEKLVLHLTAAILE